MTFHVFGKIKIFKKIGWTIGIFRLLSFPTLSKHPTSETLRSSKIMCFENETNFALVCLKYLGVSKDPNSLFGKSWIRPKIPKL